MMKSLLGHTVLLAKHAHVGRAAAAAQLQQTHEINETIAASEETLLQQGAARTTLNARLDDALLGFRRMSSGTHSAREWLSVAGVRLQDAAREHEQTKSAAAEVLARAKALNDALQTAKANIASLDAARRALYSQETREDEQDALVTSAEAALLERNQQAAACHAAALKAIKETDSSYSISADAKRASLQRLAEIRDSSVRCAALMEAIQRLNQQQTAKLMELEKNSSSVAAEGLTILVGLQNEASVLECSLDEAEATARANRNELRKCTREFENAAALLDAREKDVQNAEQSFAEASQQHENARLLLEMTRRESASMRDVATSDAAHRAAELETLRSQLEDSNCLQKQVEDMCVRTATANSSLREVVGRVSDARRRVCEARSTLRDMESRVDALRGKRRPRTRSRRVQHDQGQQNESMVAAEAEASKASAKLEKANSRLHEAQQRIRGVEELARRLEERNADVARLRNEARDAAKQRIAQEAALCAARKTLVDKARRLKLDVVAMEAAEELRAEKLAAAEALAAVDTDGQKRYIAVEKKFAAMADDLESRIANVEALVGDGNA